MTVHYRENSSYSGNASPVILPPKNAKKFNTWRSVFVNPYRSGGKRILDLAACLLSSPVVVPLIAVLAFLVARDGGKPFYSQDRIGRDGRVYRIWKLRSMVKNADDILESYLESDPQSRTEWDQHQKLKTDPRITPFGHFLRRSSLDELPQLWNVVCGQMSLVGPRPMMTCQQALYPGRDYYDMLPGISGSWQVSQRNSSTFADRAGFDTSYKRDLSLLEDLRILKKTVSVVVKATGH